MMANISSRQKLLFERGQAIAGERVFFRQTMTSSWGYCEAYCVPYVGPHQAASALEATQFQLPKSQHTGWDECYNYFRLNHHLTLPALRRNIAHFSRRAKHQCRQGPIIPITLSTPRHHSVEGKAKASMRGLTIGIIRDVVLH